MYPFNTDDDRRPVHNPLGLALLAVSFLGLSACSESDGNGMQNSDTTMADGGPGVDTNNPALIENDKEFVDTEDPNDNVPVQAQGNIADTLLNSIEYSTLLGIIQEADLTSALRNDNSGQGWTLFAPTNLAFETDEFEALDSSGRISLLKNHLHSGQKESTDLMPGALPMTEGSVEITLDAQGLPVVGGANIIARDRRFSNGIIHFVDSLLEAN